MCRHFVLARGRSCRRASPAPADAEGAGRAACAAAATRARGHPRRTVRRGVARYAAHQRCADAGGHPAAQSLRQRRRQRPGVYRDDRQDRLPPARAGAGHARARSGTGGRGRRRGWRFHRGHGSARAGPGGHATPSLALPATSIVAGAGPVDAGRTAGDDGPAAAPCAGQLSGGGGGGERHAGDRQPAAALSADHRHRRLRNLSHAVAGWFAGGL